MKFYKTLLAGVITLGFATSAYSAPITVSGVTWDPDVGADFDAGSSVYENALNSGADGIFGDVTDPITGVVSNDDISTTISGYGEISDVNGKGAVTFAGDGFCESGCQLTFAFGGYELDIVNSTFGANSEFRFTGGWVNWYVDNGTIMDFSDPANLTMADAVDGTLWLSLLGHLNYDVDTASFATLAGDATFIGTGADTGDGGGLLDVAVAGGVGNPNAGEIGVANDNFDTDARSDSNASGGLAQGFADLQFTSTFSPANVATFDGLVLEGDVDFSGNTIAVPEPSTLALLSLSILGFSGLRRRNKA